MNAVALAPESTVPKMFVAKYEVEQAKWLAVDLYYVTRDSEMVHVLDWLRTQTQFGLDIETDGIQWWTDEVATVQVGNPFIDEPRAYVIDVRCISAEMLEPLWDILRGRKARKIGQNIGFECRFLQYWFNCAVRRVYDTQINELIIRAGLFPINKTTGESGEASRKAYSATSMGALYQRYFGIEIEKDKELRTSFFKTPPGKHNQRQLHYAAGDVVYPFYIARAQKVDIDARQLDDILRIEYEVIPILADAELKGLPIDVGQWKVLYQEAVQNKRDAQIALDKFFTDLAGQRDLFAGQVPLRPIHPRTNKSLNYDSPEHLKWALQSWAKRAAWSHEVVTTMKRLRELKLAYGKDWLDRRQAKEPETTIDDIPDYVIPESKYVLLVDVQMNTLKLAKIRKQLPRDIVEELVKYAMASQREGTFGIAFINKHVRDGRVHTVFHQALTATGRLSSQPNLQNIPNDPRYRMCFRPAPGYKFVVADYSQIEPRLSAQASKDAVYVAAFLSHDDIYLRVAEAMTSHRPDPKSDEGKRTRQIFKVIVLALAYRMGKGKLRNELTLALEKWIMSGEMEPPTFEYAGSLHDRFLEVHEGIKAYQQAQSSKADPKTSQGKIWDRYLNDVVTWVTGVCGRKRFFPPTVKDAYTAGPNAPIQGSSATIMKAAAVRVQAYIDRTNVDAHVVNLVHDEGLWEVEESRAAELAVVVKEEMEFVGRHYITDVPVIAEYPKNTNGVVDFWTKEVKEAA